MTKRVLFPVVLALLCLAATNETYTVIVPIPLAGRPNFTISNVFGFTNCSPYCTGILYRENGQTNAFHAFGIPFVVHTNPAAKK